MLKRMENFIMHKNKFFIKNGKSRSTCKIGHYSQLEDKQNKKHNTEN
jgi:hypothetical protein